MSGIEPSMATPVTPKTLPRVLLVGGPDVDARLELMRRLSPEFGLAAAGTSDRLQHHFSTAGFEYHHYPMADGVSPLGDLMAVIRLVRIFRSVRPDVVHTFDTKPGVWAVIAARFAGVPVIVNTITGLGSLYSSNDVRTVALRRIYEPLQRVVCQWLATHTVFQNTVDRAEFTGRRVVTEQGSSVIAGSGVDTEAFDPKSFDGTERRRLRAEVGVGDQDVVVLMVSRLVKSKGIGEFVQAAQQLGSSSPNCRFVLVGPHEVDGANPLSTAAVDELSQSVIWTGKRSDIPELMAMSDVFVLPSAYREGVPRVLLEAGAMGLALVATDTPGCNDVVRPMENGVLIPTGDAGALATAVEQLVGDSSMRERFGSRSRAIVVDEFDIDRVAGLTSDLYRDLLGARLV